MDLPGVVAAVEVVEEDGGGWPDDWEPPAPPVLVGEWDVAWLVVCSLGYSGVAIWLMFIWWLVAGVASEW